METKRVSRLTTKRGRYGCSKVKAFQVLSNYKSHNRWVSLRELCIITGITYYSLGRTMPRWARFKYVTRQPLEVGGDWTYMISETGAKWLRIAKFNLPNYKTFIAELEVWQDKMTDELATEIVNLPFKEFTEALDKLVKSPGESETKTTDNII